MPRRPPPTSLHLHKGPVPARGLAKHTLPSLPRPVVVPSDVSRSSASRSALHVRQDSSSSPPSVYSTPDKERETASYSRPQRRSTERALEASGLGLPPLPTSSSPPPPRLTRSGSSSSSANSSFTTTPISSDSSAYLPDQRQNEVEESGDLSQRVRGPWDHSRAVSLPFDVGSVLALPKPVAISP